MSSKPQRDGYTGAGRTVNVLIGAAQPAYWKTMTRRSQMAATGRNRKCHEAARQAASHRSGEQHK